MTPTELQIGKARDEHVVRGPRSGEDANGCWMDTLYQYRCVLHAKTGLQDAMSICTAIPRTFKRCAPSKREKVVLKRNFPLHFYNRCPGRPNVEVTTVLYP